MAHIAAGSKSLTLPFSVWNAGITGVSGGLNKGDTLIISGRDFGQGPALDEVLYDSCGGTGTRTINDAEVGTWTEVSGVHNAYDATYESGGLDGGNCLRGLRYDPVALDSFQTRQVMKFPNSRKAYQSYWYRWMPDTYWNTPEATGINTFEGIDSSGKEFWLMYEDSANEFYGGTTNDIVYHGHPFGNGVAGNNVPKFLKGVNMGGEWMGAHQQEWSRFTLGVTADVDRTVPAPVYAENMYPSRVGQKIFEIHEDVAVLKDSNPLAPNVFNRREIFPWYRGGDLTALGATLESDVDHRAWGIYYAWGENAFARVEIGNNIDHRLCTRVLCYPDGVDWWQDGEVRVKVEVGNLDFNEPQFVHLFHSDNKRVMSFPLSTLQG